MRSIFALRDRFALTVTASCLTFLAPAVSAQEAPTAAGEVPRFESAQCPDLSAQLAKARCGYLVVPEDRNQPISRTIRLFVAIRPGPIGPAGARSGCLAGDRPWRHRYH
jgi:hypothetical protein